LPLTLGEDRRQPFQNQQLGDLLDNRLLHGLSGEASGPAESLPGF